ncbi:hypothetical protein GCM10007301_13470 [Azorhizobium oxalatiphilum]|uniref:Uncharacterized protein n=1 Tax=Azorhizobium oxalatiphilum TaxID=980631 RepID=A0A917BRW0_9HYPH|nr:hypothetical protein [Azorhizobium oxalatiphilum]GGF55176.1 hypothetical protein GCM10007301_13470 [Azorhizobium oxalatiphilum]
MTSTVPPRPATREEIAVLARNAGLDLPPEIFEELVQAYGNIEPMLMRLRRSRDRADEPAHVFDPRKFMPETA